MAVRIHSRAIAIGIMTLAMGSGAPCPASELSSIRSLLENRQERVVIQQWDLSCGAAALATILKYQFDEPVTERELALELIKREEYLADPSLVTRRQGFSLLDLQRVVEGRRFKGLGLGRLSFGNLLEYAPLIVPIRLNGYNHFVVFRGTYRGQVVLADPSWGNRTLSVDAFERAWIDYPEIGRIGFAVLNQDGNRRANRLAPGADDLLIAPADFNKRDQLRVSQEVPNIPLLLSGTLGDVSLGQSSAGGAVARGIDPGGGAQAYMAGTFEPNYAASGAASAESSGAPAQAITTLGGWASDTARATDADGGAATLSITTSSVAASLPGSGLLESDLTETTVSLSLATAPTLQAVVAPGEITMDLASVSGEFSVAISSPAASATNVQLTGASPLARLAVDASVSAASDTNLSAEILVQPLVGVSASANIGTLSLTDAASLAPEVSASLPALSDSVLTVTAGAVTPMSPLQVVNTAAAVLPSASDLVVQGSAPVPGVAPLSTRNIPRLAETVLRAPSGGIGVLSGRR